MRPKRADTSDPACVKRNILSTKNKTSCPSSSLKYSAWVNPERATLALAPALAPAPARAIAQAPAHPHALRAAIPPAIPTEVNILTDSLKKELKQ